MTKERNVSETKFSAGPWWPTPDKHGVLMLANDGSRSVMAGTGDDAVRVCSVAAQTQHKRSEAYRVECSVREANAALISAAPELYAALAFARNQVVAFALHSIGPERAEKAVAYIDAALTKARGGDEAS